MPLNTESRLIDPCCGMAGVSSKNLLKKRSHRFLEFNIPILQCTMCTACKQSRFTFICTLFQCHKMAKQRGCCKLLLGHRLQRDRNNNGIGLLLKDNWTLDYIVWKDGLTMSNHHQTSNGINYCGQDSVSRLLQDTYWNLFHKIKYHYYIWFLIYGGKHCNHILNSHNMMQ